ncbi:helix-turn-helix domain-containing protein [Halobaculum sp. MBLA0147]|uniref:helix-turn-helix domain-containing protein n=1 Tax=Halobaculum sp. MBLA0147 TaxID=3079934 RepID=UPI00352327DF
MSLTRLELSASLPREALPQFYVTVADSAAIAAVVVHDWNFAANDAATVLYEVDGDATQFAAAARATDGVSDVAVSTDGGERRCVLVTAAADTLPFFRTFLVVTARAGLLVRKPAIYREFETRGVLLGQSSALQSAVDAAPPGVDVTVESVGSAPVPETGLLEVLSDRQREALLAAVDAGYYDHPRETTHRDLATRLDCAPTTVGEHLQKAEAKLVAAVVEQSPSVEDGNS